MFFVSFLIFSCFVVENALRWPLKTMPKRRKTVYFHFICVLFWLARHFFSLSPWFHVSFLSFFRFILVENWIICIRFQSQCIHVIFDEEKPRAITITSYFVVKSALRFFAYKNEVKKYAAVNRFFLLFFTFSKCFLFLAFFFVFVAIEFVFCWNLFIFFLHFLLTFKSIRLLIWPKNERMFAVQNFV